MDVNTNNQNIDMVFANTSYYIDFYQRQYKWDDEAVKRLLDDIFYKFNIEYKRFKDSDIDIEKIVDKYSWYYLNTFVTNDIDGKKYIVDGQQRLTTLTLILIKLKHKAKVYGSGLSGWISQKIAGQSGYRTEFWMNHELHKSTMQSLFDSDSNLDAIKTDSGITSVNMVKNYKLISKLLDFELVDIHKFERFIFYFLKRLVLINLNVEQTDVPMVFEVINDRGVRLKSYEILKGKLLGQVEKHELKELNLNELWDEIVGKINSFKDDEIDNFFIYYLRSRFASKVGDSRKFDRDYHRVMFLPEINNELKLLHNPKEVKSFIINDLKYYASLYAKIYSYSRNENNEYISLYYNYLNEMDSQFLLILSACNLNDENEDEKIKFIAYYVDKLFSLLQLQRTWDSNDFNVAIYKICAEIRGKDCSEIGCIFDSYLLSLLSDARGVEAIEVYSYGLFKDAGIELSKRFKRYFFARIEKFISENTNLNMKHSFYNLVSNTGSVNGFHIEHILAQNLENYKLFDDDEERFERERNRLGGLLLLKGQDNSSSNNESYEKKLQTYSNTLYWNETLREDSYKSKLDFAKMIQKYGLQFRWMNRFGQEELEERHKLLFDIIRIIWK